MTKQKPIFPTTNESTDSLNTNQQPEDCANPSSSSITPKKPFNLIDKFNNLKVCPKCAKKKPLDRFKPRSDGSISYCYACQIKYYRDYNKNVRYNPNRYTSPEAREAEIKREHDKYHKSTKLNRMNRKLILVNLCGGCCVWCGYNKNIASLDFDHIDPSTKEYAIGNLLISNAPEAWELALNEVKKCQLFCSNCHREKTHPDWAMQLVLELSQLPDPVGRPHQRIVIPEKSELNPVQDPSMKLEEPE